MASDAGAALEMGQKVLDKLEALDGARFAAEERICEGIAVLQRHVEQLASGLSNFIELSKEASSSTAPAQEATSPEWTPMGDKASRKTMQESEKRQWLEMHEPRFPVDMGPARSRVSRAIRLVPPTVYVRDGTQIWRSLVGSVRNPVWPGWMIWHSIGIILLLADMIGLPYIAAWDVPQTGAIELWVHLELGYWTADMVMNIFVGYYKDNIFVSSPVKIVYRYVTTWFWFDASLLAVDWISVSSHIFDGHSVLKLGRLLKLGKLIRFVRFRRTAAHWFDFFDRRVPEHGRYVFASVWWITLTMWLTHLTACAWFGLGSSGAGAWVRKMAKEDPGRRQGQYVMALHWAVATIGGGSVDIEASTGSESVFTCFCIGFGLFAASYVVSALSSMMTEVQSQSAEKSRKLRVLRRFLDQRDLLVPLRTAIKDKVGQRLQERQLLREKDVELLSLVPVTLQMQLRFAFFEPYVTTYPLFRCLVTMTPSWCQHLAHILEETWVQAPDTFFKVGERAAFTWHLMSGSLQYVLDDEDDPASPVNSGMWISISALWVHWRHVGRADVSADCRLLAVSAEGLSAAVAADALVSSVIHGFAVAWCRRFKRQEHPLPHDLSVAGTTFGDLVLDLDGTVARPISDVALGEFQKRTWQLPRATFDKLREDILNDKVTLVVNEAGAFEKWSEVVTFRVEEVGGDDPTAIPSVLMELGTIEDDGRLTVSVRFPGGTRQRSEAVDAAVERLFKWKLDWLESVAAMDSFTISEQGETSQVNRSGLLSIYKKIIVGVKLEAAPAPQASLLRFDKQRRSTNSRLSIVPHLLRKHSVYDPCSFLESSRGSEGHTQGQVRLLPLYWRVDQGKYYAFLSVAEVEYFQSEVGEYILREALDVLGISI